jgi:hypothetical protein
MYFWDLHFVLDFVVARTAPNNYLLYSTISQVEVHELVQVIHAAAQDPTICALYGTFGHGFEFSSGGWAHIEEIRNALQVWRESHRIHVEPNLNYDKILVRPSHGTVKPSYAYAVSTNEIWL